MTDIKKHTKRTSNYKKNCGRPPFKSELKRDDFNDDSDKRLLLFIQQTQALLSMFITWTGNPIEALDAVGIIAVVLN